MQVLDPLVWKELYALLLDSELIQAQAERWLGNKTTAPSPNIQIKEKLSTLKEEESRYAKAYGLGYMSEDIFHQCMTDVQKRQQKLLEELAATPEDSNPLHSIDAATLAQAALEALGDLNFEDKKFIVRKVTDKIAATQTEVTIWGKLPLNLNSKVTLRAKSRHRRPSQRR